MGLKQVVDGDVAARLASVTGLGWTASGLGFLGTVLGYGNSVVGRLVADPQSLLYVGGICFLATLGLDRLAAAAADDADTDRSTIATVDESESTIDQPATPRPADD